MSPSKAPDKKWDRYWRPAGILAMVTFVVAQVSPVINQVTWDESQLVYDARRLLAGQVPYKDFFAFVQPGCLALMSGGPWGWWGRPETGVRYLTVASVLFGWAISWWALRRSRILPGFPAGLLSALFPVVIFPFSVTGVHHWLAVSFYLAAIAFCSRAWDEPENLGRWFLGGFWTGMAASILQTEAAFASIVVAMGLLGTSTKVGTLVRRASAALAGFCVPLAAFLAPVFFRGGGRDWFYRTFVWTLTTYRHPGNTNYQPFLVDLPTRLADLWNLKRTASAWLGYPRAIAGSYLYVTFLAIALALVIASLLVLARAARTRRLPEVGILTAAVITLFSAGVFNLSGPGWLHLDYTLPSLLLLWGLVIARGSHEPSRLRIMRWLFVSLLGAGVICHGALLLQHVPAGWELTDVDRVDRESPLNQSLRESRLLKPGDTIAVLPFGGNIYLYSYPAALGYTYLFPLRYGYHELNDQRKAAEELKRNKPKLILVHKVAYRDFLTPGTPIAEVLTQDYVPISETPALVVLERRSGLGSRDTREPEDSLEK